MSLNLHRSSAPLIVDVPPRQGSRWPKWATALLVVAGLLGSVMLLSNLAEGGTPQERLLEARPTVTIGSNAVPVTWQVWEQTNGFDYVVWCVVRDRRDFVEDWLALRGGHPTGAEALLRSLSDDTVQVFPSGDYQLDFVFITDYDHDPTSTWDSDISVQITYEAGTWTVKYAMGSIERKGQTTEVHLYVEWTD